MWRPNEPAEEGVSALPDIEPQRKRRRSRGAWHDGLVDQTAIRNFEDARAYRAFERVLVGNVDPRSVIELELVHRLASLFWRLRRAGAIETGLFELQGEALPARWQDPCRGPSQPGTPSTRANGHSKVPGSNGRDDTPASGFLLAAVWWRSFPRSLGQRTRQRHATEAMPVVETAVVPFRASLSRACVQP